MPLKVTVARSKASDSWWKSLSEVGLLSNRESEIIADAARRGIALNFERESEPSGEPWVPLARRTQAERRLGIDGRGIRFSVGAEHPILVRTGDLKRSFTDPQHPRNVTQFMRILGRTIIILSAEDDPKTPNRIRTLNSGGLTMSNSIVPARPFIGLSRDAERQVENQATQVIYQRMRRLGAK